MSDPRPEPPINPLPPVVVALFLVIVVLEGAFGLGARGLVGGPGAIGWRVAAMEEYGFSPRILEFMWDTGRWDLGQLKRLVTYPFVHASFTHAIFAGAMLLALGKMVGEAFGDVATVLIFFGSAAGGVVIYTVAMDANLGIVGAFPPVYGLIGAFTYILWLRLGQMGEQQVRAFTLIGFLMGVQLLFGLLFGATVDWIADIGAFAVGFAMSIFLAPGGWARIVARLRGEG